MKIENFNQSENRITFDVIIGCVRNQVEIDKTDYGTTQTDIDDFTETLSDNQYSQLEDFVEACSGMIHRFYHY